MAKGNIAAYPEPGIVAEVETGRYNFGKCEKVKRGHSIPNFSYLCSLQNSERRSSAVSACVPDFKT